MQLILNIGLDVGATSSIAAHVALQIVSANNFRVERSKVVQSDTEPTLVVEIQVFDLPFLAWAQLKQIAIDLHQDCIAAYNPDKGKGALIGPRAAAWGPFNPEFFILPNGKRLAQPATKAAA